MQPLQVANAVVFTALFIAAVRLLIGYRSRATRWLVVAFGALALIGLNSLVAGTQAESRPGVWLTRLIIVVLALHPYALYRFAVALGFSRGRAGVWSTVAFAALVVISAFLPVTGQDEPRPAWYQAWVVAYLAGYLALAVGAAVRLLRNGRGQPSVVRWRMRTLATGILTFSGALLVAGAGQSENNSALAFLQAALPLVGGVLILVGFLPPDWLRVLWRRREEARLAEVQADLVSAEDIGQVAGAVLPRVSTLVGGRSAILLDEQSAPIGAHGLTPDEADDLAARIQAAAAPDEVAHEQLVVPFGSGRLVVQLGPYTPLFGAEEIRLVNRAALLIDLALRRIHAQHELVEQERRHRKTVERANDELSALVYGISHDLRNPIVSVLGYADALVEEAGPTLTTEHRHYVERIRAGAIYMDDLIRDLLELSRVGHVDVSAERVELDALVRDVAEELGRAHPQVTFQVGELADVQMNPLRARQLFTNLMTNAVRHSGRDDVTVHVSSYLDEPWQVVTVADDGTGIDPAYRERVFGLFERLDQASGGTGIGLAICRKIVEQQGGRLWVTDAEPGAAFSCQLPPAR